MARSLVAALVFIGVLSSPLPLWAQSAMNLVSTIPLPGVKGRIDHLSVDTKGHRLFIAALGNDTVEVVDTQGATRESLRGFGEPQGVLYLPASNRLFVANGSADRVDILDGVSFKPIQRVEGLADADNVRFDAAAKKVVVGHGRGALRFIDAETGADSGDIALPGHPESFHLEPQGPRVFVNVPTAHSVVVVDREKRTEVARWSTGATLANYPMALDAAGRRLFVGMRMPATLLVMDTDSGKVTARLSVGGDTDDIFYDAERKRLYVVCGEGKVDVVREEGANRFVVQESIATAPGARTGLFVPEDNRLYVAAPARGSDPARILVFQLR